MTNTTTFLAKAAVTGTLGASAFAAIAHCPSAIADPLPYGPNTCIQGYVWREAAPNDQVCVTPDIRTQTAQQNSQAAQHREPNGGAYGPDTCKQGFVWRDAFAGDHVCVTPDVRTQAAADNAAAASRMAANQPTPLEGPGVSWSPRLGGLTAHINDRSGVASQCLYKSDFYERSFFLPANASYDLVIVPAVPALRNWDVSITCDNGVSTHTSTFF